MTYWKDQAEGEIIAKRISSSGIHLYAVLLDVHLMFDLGIIVGINNVCGRYSKWWSNSKGFFFLLWFKVWSHSSPQIWITGTLTYPTIVFISISKFEIFSSNSLVIALLFHISFEPNKSPGGFKKRSFMLIKGEERYLQTGASSAWAPREARTWSCLLRTGSSGRTKHKPPVPTVRPSRWSWAWDSCTHKR